MISEEFKEQYAKLNKKQKEAVDAIEGPVMVVAGPGTGKTTILTLRIANILLKTDTMPENILALTFTNSGVTAIRRKLLKQIGDRAYRVNIFTFHAFAEHVIKEFSFYFKDLEFSKVVSDLEKVDILEKIIEKGGFKEIVSKNDPFSSLAQVKDAVDTIKKEGLNPNEFKERIPLWQKELLSDENLFYKKKFGEYQAGDMKPAEKEKLDKKIAKAEEIAEVFREYQKEIREKGFYDFSDMILNVLSGLEKNKNLKLDLQEQYQYILVDEHQDTNDGQNRLIELLTDAEHLGGRPNLFTVGDEKQSIYRFQGASEKTFRHFNEVYRDVEVIDLKDNYRSTKTILDASHSLICRTVEQPTALKARSGHLDGKIKYLEFSNYKFELLYLAGEIKHRIESGTEPGEIAVIYRSNRQVSDIKDIFSQKNIPFTVVSKEYLLEDTNINKIIWILRTVANPKDNHHLAKSLFADFLGIDSYKIADTLQKFNRGNRDGNKSLFDFLLADEEFKNFTDKIKILKTKSANMRFDEFFKFFLEEIGYLGYMLQSSGSRDKLVKIDKLFDEIKRQIQNKRSYGLPDFVKFVDACQKYNLDIETNDPEIIAGVQLMTAHRSKGLEFEYVYITGTTRKNWEKSRGFSRIALPLEDYKGDTDDERRLFYVAMTRAKKELAITASLTDWEGREQEKSQFIAEINEEMIDNIDTQKFEKGNLDNLYLFMKQAGADKSIFDKEYLKNLFKEKNLNVTALNNYMECPAKYLFRNLINLPSEYSAPLLYGDIMHDSLENFFEESKSLNQTVRGKVSHQAVQGKAALIKHFRKLMEQSSFAGAEYKRYLERGEESLSEYYDEYHKNWTVKIQTEKNISREFELDDKLNGGQKITLSGRLDKIEFLDSESEWRINIIDYKTGRTFSEKTKEEKENLKRQLVFYHLLYEDDSNKNRFTINKAVLDFIEKNKKGRFEQYEMQATGEDIADLKSQINKMAAEVLSGEFLSLGCGKRGCEYCKMLTLR